MAIETQQQTPEQRLRALEDKEAILQTMYQYAHALDYGRDAAAFTDCFIDGGVWYSTIEGKWAGGGRRAIGRCRATRSVVLRNADVRGTAGHFHKHIMVEPEITSTATARRRAATS